MALHLVIGPANAGKAGELFARYRASLPDGPLLVVPTRADVVHYEAELAAGGALLGGWVTAFGGLARAVAARAGYAAARVGALRRERLIQAAAAGAGLSLLAPSAASPGFAAAAGELLAELQRSLASPGRLTGALAVWAAGDAGRAAYASEVVALYRGYLRALDRADRVDDDLFAWRALRALEAAPASWGTTPVLLYGFDDLSALQRRLLETLADAPGVEVTVSLTYEPRLALAGRSRTVEDLRPAAGTRVLALAARAEHYGHPALHHVERSLFEEEAGRAAPGEAVVLLEAQGERAEVELVAAEVLALLRAGTPPERIAVVHRRPEQVAALLEEVFDAYAIPLAGEHALALGACALGRALLALLRCAVDPEEPAAELIAYLRAPGLLRRVELADALEAQVRRDGLASVSAARAAWEERHPDFTLDILDELAGARGETLTRLLARRALALLAAPHRRRAPALRGAAALDARAAAAVLDALEQLAPEGERLDAAALLAALERIEVAGGEPPRQGAVLLTGPLGIRARRFRALILLGLQEGTFPARPSPDPFLPEEVRGPLGLSRPDERLATERALFYACVSRPTERLVLAYRTADEEGNPAQPSPFVEDVRRLLDETLTIRRRTLADVTWQLATAPTARERSLAAAAAAPREQPAVIASLAGPDALAALRHQVVLSAGALESYAACPVRWLVQSELNPKRLEPEPEPMARGTAIHRVLERTLADLRARTGSARVSAESRPLAEQLLRAALFAERGSLAPGRGRGAAATGLARAEADLLDWLEQAERAPGRYEPAHLELRFGMGDEDGIEALSLDGGALLVRGVIDRVDVCKDDGSAVVVDYKTGRGRPGWAVARWREDDQLQVALYMLAVRDGLRVEPVGGVYQPLAGDDRRPRGMLLRRPDFEDTANFVATDLVDEERLAQELASAERSAVALARELRAGRLAPTPGSCLASGCAFPGICRSMGP